MKCTVDLRKNMVDTKTYTIISEAIDKFNKDVEEGLRENMLHVMPCKYLLPCGKCDKTDQMCSQYCEVKILGENK